ncbi:MAG: hypothetical protein ACI8P9_000042 [Parasphingorhabdus sp.]|jgi:hypothetical protein
MKTKAFQQHIDHAAAWRADQFNWADVIFEFSVEHRRVLESALAKVNHAGLKLEEISSDNFDLSEMAEDLSDWYDRVMHGSGLVLLEGFPVEQYSTENLERMYWGFGCYFGQGVSQSVLGDIVGHVTDMAGKDPNERAYRSSLELPPHTDHTDIIGMLSIRAAKQGGLSTYTSALAMHNELLEHHPELLEPLYQGYYMHLFGEQEPEQPPVTPYRVPVLFEKDGFVSARIVPEYIDMAEVELDEPMSALERAAFDEFVRLSQDPSLQVSIMLQPGDITLTNNHTILHSRTAFFDHDEMEHRRYLLRLWLVAPDQRPLPEELQEVHSKGIDIQPGRDTYFEGETATVANRGRYGASD